MNPTNISEAQLPSKEEDSDVSVLLPDRVGSLLKRSLGRALTCWSLDIFRPEEGKRWALLPISQVKAVLASSDL